MWPRGSWGDMQESTSTSRHLLALTPLQRRIVAQLTRQGPANAQSLARALNSDVAEVEQMLRVLHSQGQIERDSAGQVTARLGRTRRRTLPARLWPALTASSRLYSAQEIATLRTVVPILQFARAKLSEFADHGPGHVLRVKSFATQLGYLLGLTNTEHHLLRAGALFHDVGNIIERARHHIISQETVERLTAQGKLPFSQREAAIIGLLCRWHRKEYDPQRHDEWSGQTIRTGLLASLLRVADAMDIDQRRVDYSAQFMQILQFFYPDEVPYWSSLAEIAGVRIRSTGQVTLQVLTQGVGKENMQIAMLEKDLAQTPLPWSLQVTPVEAEQAPSRTIANRGCTLLVFPFEPHSLVMAALSRHHLQAAGFTARLLCYPDQPQASAWLWREALPAHNPADFTQLVVIGDRSDASITAPMLATLEQWQRNQVLISLLNRHEANWARLPALRRAGIDVTVGGDWAYFWGDGITPQELIWARVAALCTRDPTQSTVGLTATEQILTQGLLKTVYDTLRAPPADLVGWDAAATAILDQIAGDDGLFGDARQQAWFDEQAAAFVADYATPPASSQVHGKVLVVELTTTTAPFAAYWCLEAAIEQHGRTLERGICFRAPYAITYWPDGDAVELLAISHWREEAAVPIRLLYPAIGGPTPEGNESTVRLRLPPAQVQATVDAFIAACNHA